MDLLRLSVKRETLLAIQQFLHNAAEQTLWTEDDLRKAIPQRNQTDVVRVALAWQARKWARFTHEGQECKAMVDHTKGGKGLDVRIHVRRKDAQNVSYSDLVISIHGGIGEPIVATATETGTIRYPGLVADLGNIAALRAFGEQHLFDNDVRRLVQGLLERRVVALWQGVSLVLQESTHVAIRACEVLLRGCAAGEVTCTLLSLDKTPANRQALARELGERYETEAADLQEALAYTDPNLKRCRKLYDDLVSRVQSAEALLEVEIPCWEVLCDVEMTLTSLEEAAAAAA